MVRVYACLLPDSRMYHGLQTHAEASSVPLARASENGGISAKQRLTASATCVWGQAIARGRTGRVSATLSNLRRCSTPPQASSLEKLRMGRAPKSAWHVENAAVHQGGIAIAHPPHRYLCVRYWKPQV